MAPGKVNAQLGATPDGGAIVGEDAGGEIAFRFNNPGAAVPEPSAMVLLFNAAILPEEASIIV